MAATDIATLFLDRELRILRYTPRTTDLFNIRAADRGHPLSALPHRLGYNEIIDDAELVLRDLVPSEQEVADEPGRFYLARIKPYRSSNERIEGVVLTFVDISARKQCELALSWSEAQFRALIDAAQMVWTTGPNGDVEEDSPS